MTKYVISITRTLVVEAETPEEATTMSLYATMYPEYLDGIHPLYYNLKILDLYWELFPKLTSLK